MRLHSSLGRLSRLTAAAGLCVLAAALSAAVAPRDMDKQIEFCGKDGSAGCFKISRHEIIESNGQTWHRLTLRAEEDGWNIKKAGTITALTRANISVQVDPGRIQEGRTVFLFLGKSEETDRIHPDSYIVPSFAEYYPVTTNRSKQQIVMGLGAGSAIPTNTQMSQVLAGVSTSVSRVLKNK